MRRLFVIDYNTLNPGIRRLVRWLNDHGFETCDSGDGETHECTCDREYAYVVMTVKDPFNLIDETLRLTRLVSGLGVPIAPITGDGTVVSIQASYDPAQASSFIDLMGLKDSMLPAELT